MKSTRILLLALSTIILTTCQDDRKDTTRILIYTRNGEGYVHKNINESVAALEKICAAENIATEVSDLPEVFTRDNLARSPYESFFT